MREESQEESRLEDLVHECLEKMEEEGPTALERLCKENPEQASVLRSRLEALRAAGLLGGSGISEEVLPKPFGEFELIEKIGAGGMGVVHLAEQASLQRRVALKRIHPGELHFGGSRERFEREARAIAALAHPGIAALYEASEVEGVPCLVMEYVPGMSLAEVVVRFAERSPSELSARDLRDLLLADASQLEEGYGFEGDWWHLCAHLVRQVAHALDHAHQRGVVHRDVKPSNILLSSEDGRARLVDFGLAGFQGAARVTRTGARLGSLPYTPPERLSGEEVQTGPKEDVYALGVTLFELSTLRTPFLASSTEATLKNVLAGDHRASLTGLPKDLAAICRRAMESKPDERYASCAAFARDLTNFLEGVPTEARPLGSLSRAARWARRRPASAIATGSVLAVLIAGPISWSLVQARLLKEERKHSAEMHAIATSLFTDVHDQIRDLHGSVEVRRRLIEVGMSYLDKVRSSSSSEPGLRENLAQGLMRAGDVYGHPGQPNVGELGRARECYAEAAKLWAELGREGPERLDCKKFEARAHLHAAAVARVEGELAESALLLDRAEELLPAMGAIAPMDVNVRALELQVLMDRADQSICTGDVEAAQEEVVGAGELARECLQSGLGNEEVWWFAIGRADALKIDRAVLAGGPVAGMAIVEEQRSDLRQRLRVQPESIYARLRLVELERYASRRHAESGEWDLALEAVMRAIESAGEDPPAGEVQNELALLQIHRREEAEARAALDEADRLHEAGGLRNDRATRMGLARSLELRGRVEEALSQDPEKALSFLDQAARSMRGMLEEYPQDPDVLVRCSEVLLRVAKIHLRLAGSSTTKDVEIAELRSAQNAFRSALETLEELRPQDPIRKVQEKRMASLASDVVNCDGWIAALEE